MDPFTALGVAGTIASFIQISYKLVSSAYDTYHSVSGMPKEDEQLQFVVQQLERVYKSIFSNKSARDRNDAEQAMDVVANKCLSLSVQLLEILNRSRTKNQHSLRQSAIAALRSKWHDSEKKELKKQVDECKSLFHLQFTVMMGTNTMKSLEELIKTSHVNIDQLTTLQTHVNSLKNGVTLSIIGKEAMDQLASLYQLSDSAIHSIRSQQILGSLTFPELQGRYETILNAYSDTFEWIFEENLRKSPKALQGKVLFTNWLTSGNGIFHVAGKPGSGKSTLMKFIYKNEKTKHLLSSWAAGRELIIGKFFFWKPGKTKEKSTTGLLQTLLYDILKQCLDLVPCVFPREWSRNKDFSRQVPARLHLEADDIREAFNRLIEHISLHQDRCFFIVIDGLDEFEETPVEGYKELIKLISSWTEKAPTNLKLCVSSREYPTFLEKFSGKQNLKLQDLTEDDIYKYVKEKLEDNDNFRQLEGEEDGPNMLISQVAKGSSGVFLWAALVVKLLDDACDNGDTLEQLQRKVQFLPREVRDLLHQLFDSIHESDRDESAQTFAFALKLLENESGMRLSLFRYSLLDEYNEDRHFVLRPDFAGQQFLVKDEGVLNKRLERARKQLYKRCKGLLEIIESGDDINMPGRPGYLVGTPLYQRIALVHRSIPEYLEEESISKDRMARTKGFNALDAACQTYVAEVIAFKSSQSAHDDVCYVFELVDLLSALSVGPNILQNERVAALHKLPHKLDNTQPQYFQQSPSRFRDSFDFAQRGYILTDGSISVAHCAAYSGFYQFFTAWNDHPFDEHIKDGSLARSILARMMMDRLDGDSSNNALIILDWLFRHGCSPNQAVSQPGGPRFGFGDFSLWQILLSMAIFPKGCPHLAEAFDAVRIFLEYGANPDVSFEWIPEKSRFGLVEAWGPVYIMPGLLVRYLDFLGTNSKLKHFVLSEGRQVSLREVIEHMSPPNTDILLSLIDRNMRTQQPITNTSSYHPGRTSDQLFRNQSAKIEASGDQSKSSDGSAGLEPRDISTEKASRGNTVANMVTCLKEVVTTPLATFILGVSVAYCISLYTHPPKGFDESRTKTI